MNYNSSQPEKNVAFSDYSRRRKERPLRTGISYFWECSEMPHRQLREAATALRFQAFEARALSDTFSEPNTVTDLQNFAAALEREARELMSETGQFRQSKRG
jgi:hypothetical protein